MHLHTLIKCFFLHTEMFFFTDIPFSLSRSQGSSWYPGGKISTHKSNWAAQNTSKWFQGHRNIDTEFRHYKNVFYVSYNKGFFCQAVMKHVSVPSLVWWWFHTCSCWLGEMMPTLHKHPIVPKHSICICDVLVFSNSFKTNVSHALPDCWKILDQ